MIYYEVCVRILKYRKWLKQSVFSGSALDSLRRYGITAGTIYIATRYNVKYLLSTSMGSFFGETSEQCGYKPNVSGSLIGYQLDYFPNEGYCMYSYCTYIKSDISGRRIDLYAPRNPKDFIWRFGTYVE